MAHSSPCECRYVLHSRLLPASVCARLITTPDVDYDPAKAARDERKARVAKNEKQQQGNLARSAASSSSGDRKREIDRTLAVTRTSTASLGKFDRKLEGEKALKGVKRKVSPMPVDTSTLVSASNSALF